jgi:hypothetical protein
MNFNRNKFRVRNSIFMLASVLLHLLLVLCLSNLFKKKTPPPDQFDLNAIKISNLAKAAKKKVAAKAGKKSKSQPKKRAKAASRKGPKAIPRRKPKVTTKRIAKARTTVKTKSPQIQTKKWQQNVTQKQINKQLEPVKPTIQRQVTVKRQMQYQPRENQPVKLTQKRVVYKQETKNLDRRPIEKPTLFKVTEPVKVQQRVDKVSTLKKVVNKVKVKTRQIQTKAWQQNVTQKQVDKQLEPVKPTIQRQVTVKRQMQYQSRENQPVKLTQKRVVYKRETKNLDRRPMEKPEPLEFTEEIEVVEKTKHITRFRQVTRKTTRVTRVEALPVLKDNLALEKIPLKTNIEKGTKEVKITSQREVTTIKQIAYEERASSSAPIRVSQKKVTYERETKEQNIKAIDTPDIPTEVIPVKTEAAEVNLANIAKQEFENSPAEAYTSTPSITQLAAEIPENNQNRAEKATNVTSEELINNSRGNAITQHKLDIQKTDELVAFNDFKGMQSNSFSNPLTDVSNNAGSDSGVEISVDLPYGNVTGQQLYRITGATDSDVKTASLTINDVTQLVTVIDGSFIAEVALSSGTNNLSIIAFNGKGKKGFKSFQLLFRPPKGGVPVIRLDSPKNGRQGVKQGEPIIVEGTIDDYSITKATLLLNRTPIPLEVKNGRFHKSINLPAGTIFVFRIMAQNQNGVRGFSPAHTVLSDSKVDILNPRPY